MAQKGPKIYPGDQVWCRFVTFPGNAHKNSHAEWMLHCQYDGARRAVPVCVCVCSPIRAKTGAREKLAADYEFVGDGAMDVTKPCNIHMVWWHPWPVPL